MKQKSPLATQDRFQGKMNILAGWSLLSHHNTKPAALWSTGMSHSTGVIQCNENLEVQPVGNDWPPKEVPTENAQNKTERQKGGVCWKSHMHLLQQVLRSSPSDGPFHQFQCETSFCAASPSQSPLCYRSFLGGLGLVTCSQPSLPHRVVVRRGKWCWLLWVPSGGKKGTE